MPAFIGRTSGNDRDDGGVAEAFGNRRSDFALGFGLIGLELLELSGCQIAGIRV